MLKIGFKPYPTAMFIMNTLLPTWCTLYNEYMVKLVYHLFRMGCFHYLFKNEKDLYKMSDILDAFIQ